MPRPKKNVLARRQYAKKVSLAAAEARSKNEPVASTSTPLATHKPPTHIPPTPPSSTSSKKWKSFVLEEETTCEGKERVRIIIEEGNVKELVSNMVCSVSFSDKVDVNFTRHQIDTYIIVKYECGLIILDTHRSTQVKTKNFHPLPLLFVYSVMLLGIGYDGANKIMSFLSLKHFTHNTYIRCAKYLAANVIDHTKSVLEKCRSAVFQNYEQKGLDDGCVNVDATFDGSWHKRGHKSKFDIGAVIDVDCGLVIEYHVCSKLCNMCSSKYKALKNQKKR